MNDCGWSERLQKRPQPSSRKNRFEIFFIDNDKKTFPLNLLCKVMLVSRSGYYHWKKRSPLARQQERAQRIPRVRGFHQDSKATYVRWRMAQQLKALGFRCDKLKAGTLVKLAGVAAKQRKRFKATTDSNHQLPVAPNPLNRRFSVTTPNCILYNCISRYLVMDALIMSIWRRKPSRSLIFDSGRGSQIAVMISRNCLKTMKYCPV